MESTRKFDMSISEYYEYTIRKRVLFSNLHGTSKMRLDSESKNGSNKFFLQWKIEVIDNTSNNYEFMNKHM